MDLYKKYRLDGQVRDFYTPRSEEYRSAFRQSLVSKSVLLALGAIAGALAGANVGGHRVLWSVLAATFPALSTALVAYDGLISYERLAKLYSDVVGSVGRVDRPSGPNLLAPDVTDYVATVEGIFLREQGQWGQLTRDIELQAPASPK
ncbi:MAG TPA: SLATT domain-containing protein [Solirubrobacteraceae bacterium]|nr:SLATT domain-containing protein [Solirubrobacteraceae bacterium]